MLALIDLGGSFLARVRTPLLGRSRRAGEDYLGYACPAREGLPAVDCSIRGDDLGGDRRSGVVKHERVYIYIYIYVHTL